MANILVKHYQATTLEQAIAKAPLRVLSYVTSTASLMLKEDDSTLEGIVRQFPSLVGQGMGRRVSRAAHGFLVGQPVRWTSSGWVLAQATAAESTLATHMVVAVPSANAFEVASFGAWNLGGSPAGTYYLSATAGQLTTTAPTGVLLQKIAVGDGTSYHLTFSRPATSFNHSSILGIIGKTGEEYMTTGISLLPGKLIHIWGYSQPDYDATPTTYPEMKIRIGGIIKDIFLDGNGTNIHYPKTWHITIQATDGSVFMDINGSQYMLFSVTFPALLEIGAIGNASMWTIMREIREV